MNKKYIDTGSARGAEILAQYLELCGYSYGYPVSGKCQPSDAGNMPFITIHEDLQLYSVRGVVRTVGKRVSAARIDEGRTGRSKRRSTAVLQSSERH